MFGGKRMEIDNGSLRNVSQRNSVSSYDFFVLRKRQKLLLILECNIILFSKQKLKVDLCLVIFCSNFERRSIMCILE